MVLPPTSDCKPLVFFWRRTSVPIIFVVEDFDRTRLCGFFSFTVEGFFHTKIWCLDFFSLLLFDLPIKFFLNCHMPI